jgi:hypothetical protein
LFPGICLPQIVDAVVVARYLGATLVLPDIRGSKPGDERLVLSTALKEPVFLLVLLVI